MPTVLFDPNAVIGIWSTTWRPQNRTLSARRERRREAGTGSRSRVSGRPLINEVVVPRAAKDLFNASSPSQDAQFAGGVLDPEVPKLLKALFNINSPAAPRNDLLNLVLGFGG